VKVSSFIIDFLKLNCIDIIFGYPGYSSLPLYNAFQNDNLLKHVLVRHEESSIHAAHGYIKSTDKPCVCIASKGPGSTNLVTGIATAWADSIPVFAITCNISEAYYGKRDFQDVDIVNIVKPITKFTYHIHNKQEIPEIFNIAFETAWTNRQGPVLIDIPVNILSAEINLYNSPLKKIEFTQSRLKANDRALIKKSFHLLKASKKPLLIVGNGGRKHVKIIRELINILQIPVIHTVSGTGIINSNDPLYGGLLHSNSNSNAINLLQEADLLIALGTTLDSKCIKYPSRCSFKLIHVDIDEFELNKNIKAAIPVKADIKKFIQYFLTLLPDAKVIKISTFGWLKKSKKNNSSKSKNEKLKQRDIISFISKLRQDFIIVSGSGSHKYNIIDNFCFRNPEQFIVSARFGCMGFSLPASIGVAFGNKKRIIVMTGDGDIQMTIQELASIKEYCHNIKIIILNNRMLGLTKKYQLHQYGKKGIFETDFKLDLNFNAIAQAYGIKAFTIRLKNDIKLLSKLNDMGLALFDCRVND